MINYEIEIHDTALRLEGLRRDERQSRSEGERQKLRRWAEATQARLDELVEEMDMGTTGYDPYEDLQERPNGRQAKIAELQRTVQVLQGRLYARDAIIERQQAKIRRLQEIIAQQRPVIVSEAVTA